GEISGDAETPILAARALSEARAGDITFAEDERHLATFHATNASAVVIPTRLSPNGKPTIRVPDALIAFVAIVRHLHGKPEPPPSGIDPLASVHPTAEVGIQPSIYPYAVIGEGSILGARCRVHSGVVIGRDCHIGNDVTLFPNVVLYDGCILGDRVI